MIGIIYIERTKEFPDALIDRSKRKEKKERKEEARLGGRLGVIYPWGPVGGCFVLGSAVQDWSDVWQLTDDEAAFQFPFRPPFTPPTCWFSPEFGFWRVHYSPRGKVEPGITGLLAEIGTYVMRFELFFSTFVLYPVALPTRSPEIVS